MAAIHRKVSEYRSFYLNVIKYMLLVSHALSHFSQEQWVTAFIPFYSCFKKANNIPKVVQIVSGRTVVCLISKPMIKIAIEMFGWLLQASTEPSLSHSLFCWIVTETYYMYLIDTVNDI